MSGDWRERLREETRRAPAGAQERVWRAMQEATPVSRSPLVFALPLALAVAALAAFLVWPPGLETRSWQTADAALTVRQAKASWNPESNEVTLEQGQLALSVWGGRPLLVKVLGRSIEIESASLLVRVAGDSVVIAPTRGAVLVDGQRLEASEATRAEAGELGLTGLEPFDVAARQAGHRAQRAVEGQRWEEAVAALAEVGRTGTLAAEAALVRKGELELRGLQDPARALATFEALGARFPKGSLVQERELSALEAELALARWPAVQRRAEAFLAAFPTSERGLEVRRVLATSELQQGARVEGCAQVRTLPRGFAEDLDRACSLER